MALCSNFYNPASPELSAKFAQMWLESIERVEREQHRDYFEAYFVGLSPRHLKRREIVAELRAILARHQADSEKALLVKLVREEIADMDLLIAIQTA